jgi:hypothetical protein
MAHRHGPFIVILFLEFPRHPELAGLIDRPWSMVKAVEALILRYQEEEVLRPGSSLQAVIDLIGPVIYRFMIKDALPSIELRPIDAASHVARFLDGHRAEVRPK